MLVGLLFASVCMASNLNTTDGNGIIIKRSGTQNTPRDLTFDVSINSHTLTVFINQNIGQVAIEVTTASGSTVYSTTTSTPGSEIIYISSTGDYTIVFTLSDGDEYYGEFTITD